MDEDRGRGVNCPHGIHPGFCPKCNPEERVDRLEAEITRLQGENEQLRVQLAGCGVAAMCNTRRSMEEQRCKKGDYGWSISYGDVLRSVEEQIKLREENERWMDSVKAAHDERDRYREALEKIARLGNGANYGTSEGNWIARDALKGDEMRENPYHVCEHPKVVVHNYKHEDPTSHHTENTSCWCNPRIECPTCYVVIKPGEALSGAKEGKEDGN
jgi:hypothetical protein